MGERLSPPQRPLCIVGRLLSPARFLFFSIIDILMGIPSGSLCGGERANAVFQNHGVCGQAFPSLLSPSPLIPFFRSRPNFLDELARKRLLCRLQFKQSRFLIRFLITGTQREYSSKPLEHSIAKRILVLKR